jgi:hypothetical protein
MEVRILDRRYFEAYDKDSLEKAERLRIRLINTAEYGTLFIKSLPNYYGDNTLKQAAINSIGFYKSEAHHELARFLALKKRDLALARRKVTDAREKGEGPDSPDEKRQGFSDFEKNSRSLIKRLEKTRLENELAFEERYSEFLGSRLYLR